MLADSILLVQIWSFLLTFLFKKQTKTIVETKMPN